MPGIKTLPRQSRIETSHARAMLSLSNSFHGIKGRFLQKKTYDFLDNSCMSPHIYYSSASAPVV